MSELPEATEELISADRLHNATILVVEDVELSLKMLVHSLQAHGFKKILTAMDGSEALTISREHRPDIVILDIMMPTMDGFAYLKAIREDISFKNMPILVQTALDEIDKKLKAFDLGASDYICKPIEPRELLARTIVHLSKKILTEDLIAYKKRMLIELKIGQAMQQRLIPNANQLQMYERIYNMKIAEYFETSSAMGGDSWGVTPLSNNRLAIYMIDFSGHGIGSAMNLFRMHTIMHELQHAGGDPANFLAELNRHLHPLLERTEFATMFYGVMDTDANCLLYASAASPSPQILSSVSGEVSDLIGRGFPLGVVDNAVYETKFVPFMEGDLLLLYSDSLIETANYSGEVIKEEELKKYIKTASDKKSENPAKQTVDDIMAIFKSHNPEKIKDDLTINAYYRCSK